MALAVAGHSTCNFVMAKTLSSGIFEIAVLPYIKMGMPDRFHRRVRAAASKHGTNLARIREFWVNRLKSKE